MAPPSSEEHDMEMTRLMPPISLPDRSDASTPESRLDQTAAGAVDPALSFVTEAQLTAKLNALLDRRLQAADDKRKDDLHEAEEERQIKRVKWFQRLATVFFLNVGLWVTLIFQVYQLGLYETHHHLYQVIGWVVIFGLVGLLPLVFIWTPTPAFLLKRRQKIARYRPSANWVAVINAVLCFILIIVYFVSKALPDYKASKWIQDSKSVPALQFPGFAILRFDGDDRMANFATGSDPPECTVYNFPVPPSVTLRASTTTTTTSSSYTPTLCPTQAFQDSLVNADGYEDDYDYSSNGLRGRVFNPKQPGMPSTMQDLNDAVLLNSVATYTKDELYDTGEITEPYFNVAMYDARLNTTELLRHALACELIVTVPIPALAFVMLSFSATYIEDSRQLLLQSDPQLNGPTCAGLHDTISSFDDPPCTSYAYEVASLRLSNISSCDITTGQNVGCWTSVEIFAQTHIVNTMISQPGTDAVNILLQEGAIVGAVQFFLWFLGIFSQPD